MQVFLRSITFLSILFIVSCASAQFESELPFTIKSIDYKESSGSYTFNIEGDEEVIVPQKAYFRNQSSTNIKKDDNTLTILFSKNGGRNIVMHKDPKKEFGNTLPSNTESRFKLDDNEMVLIFGEGENEKLYKIKK